MIHSLIDHSLKDHRESDSGWADITLEDMKLLQEIIKELIKLKCDRDADRDLPIEFVRALAEWSANLAILGVLGKSDDKFECHS